MGGATEPLPAKKQTTQSESDVQIGEKKMLSIRNPDLVLPNTQLVNTESQGSVQKTDKIKNRQNQTMEPLHDKWTSFVARRPPRLPVAKNSGVKSAVEAKLGRRWVPQQGSQVKKTRTFSASHLEKTCLAAQREKKNHLCFSTWKTARRAAARYRRTRGGAAVSVADDSRGERRRKGAEPLFTSVVPFSRWL